MLQPGVKLGDAGHSFAAGLLRIVQHERLPARIIRQHARMRNGEQPDLRLNFQNAFRVAMVSTSSPNRLMEPCSSPKEMKAKAGYAGHIRVNRISGIGGRVCWRVLPCAALLPVSI